MNRNFSLTTVLLALLCVATSDRAARADAAPSTQPASATVAATKIAWSAVAVDGAKLSVPSPDKPTVIACVRPNQSQSTATLQHVRKVLDSPGAPAARVIVLVSGERAGDAPKQLAGELAPDWPVVLDPEFAATGIFDVHVWPTTVIIGPDGSPAGHLGGISGSFAADLEDYLAYAAGKIDESTLQARLAEHRVVADGPAQRAQRQALVAMRMLNAGHVDQAAGAIEEGLRLRPDDPKLLVQRARLLLAQQRPDEAMNVLASIPEGAAPSWQFAELRGRALVDLERWDEARAVLDEALRLNPRPAEAHYLLGRVHEHAGDWQAAARSFRSAYEARSRSAVSGF